MLTRADAGHEELADGWGGRSKKARTTRASKKSDAEGLF
jgi:hypothetical protein